MKKIPFIVCIAAMVMSGIASDTTGGNLFTGIGLWPEEVPADCPFPKSGLFSGMSFTGRHAEYQGADTWYPSWASDGKMYSPWTDGGVNGLTINSMGMNARIGFATILGDDPLKLQVVDEGCYKSDPTPYTGHFYAVGELLLTKKDLLKPVDFLPRSPLFAEKKYPFENGFTAEAPHRPISSFADCIFFNGLTSYNGKWWLYYGGSEYYTCLATTSAKN